MRGDGADWPSRGKNLLKFRDLVGWAPPTDLRMVGGAHPTRLTCIPLEELLQLQVSPFSAQFLASTGLPDVDRDISDSVSIGFNLAGKPLQGLASLTNDPKVYHKYRSFSNCPCLDQTYELITIISPDDTLLKVDSSCVYEPAFLNSNIMTLVLFLSLIVVHFRSTCNMDDLEKSYLDIGFAQCIQALDPAAMSNPDLWWPIIIERMLDLQL